MFFTLIPENIQYISFKERKKGSILKNKNFYLKIIKKDTNYFLILTYIIEI